jgi:transcriptional regulator with XRE-family HTH domain
MLGTSKARVLAYEAGTSIPEPRRIQQIARIFRVHPRELHAPIRGRYVQLKDLRSYAGLTAAELAEQVGVSRATYRDIETKAILPVRDDGTLPLRLSEALDIPLRMIHRALEHHPVAAERRLAIGEYLKGIFDRAHVQYEPAVVNPDEPHLLEITTLLRRPASVVCRLVNHELGGYRALLRRHAISRLDVAYAQSAKAADEASRQGAAIEEAIIARPLRAAATLAGFLAEAMTSQQWRTVVNLMDTGHAWSFDGTGPTDGDEAEVWRVLIARGVVSADRGGAFPEGVKMTMTSTGLRRCMQEAPLYGCLYPRIASPRLPVSRRLIS